MIAGRVLQFVSNTAELMCVHLFSVWRLSGPAWEAAVKKKTQQKTGRDPPPACSVFTVECVRQTLIKESRETEDDDRDHVLKEGDMVL